jgi:hypothetical protein
LANDLKPNAKPVGVIIKLMCLTFRLDMMFPNAKEDLLIFPIWFPYVLDVIFLWEANTLSRSGVRNQKIQNGFNLFMH